jgi:glycogen(starch) synthase
MKIKTLMLGWEFPPYISGGLGTACYGLTKAMGRMGMEVTFLLPRMGPVRMAANPEMTLESGFPHVRLRAVPSSLMAYGRRGNPRSTQQATAGTGVLEEDPGGPAPYGPNICEEVQRYAMRVMKIAESEEFDVIHAHDWMTFPAGMALAARSQRPLIVQIHATEFDRSGEQNMNPALYEIERRGMEAAVTVITVSHLTKRTIVERYGIAPEKVRVIHNGIELKASSALTPTLPHKEKTVLFLGRITMQKGPEFFVEAATRVLERLDNVRFIMAGWGDLGPQVVEQVAALGLGDRIHFAGFLRGKEVERAYRMADVYVLPSVSEPFGLTVLEAIQYGVPVILSKTSGVGEVIPTGVLRCDFWDTHDMASKILAVLKHPELAEHLRQRAYEEIRPLTWDAAARKCLDVYREALSQPAYRSAG